MQIHKKTVNYIKLNHHQTIAIEFWDCILPNALRLSTRTVYLPLNCDLSILIRLQIDYKRKLECPQYQNLVPLHMQIPVYTDYCNIFHCTRRVDSVWNLATSSSKGLQSQWNLKQLTVPKTGTATTKCISDRKFQSESPPKSVLGAEEKSEGEV